MTRARFSLLKQLVVREIVGRYRGSLLGLAWSLLIPLAMLAVYVFVFGVVFQARWSSEGNEGTHEFALGLFASLIVFNFFAEAVSRAPGVIVSQPNYVKKVVFPLALLPVSVLGAAIFHALMSSLVLYAALLWFGKFSLWSLALPFVWLPLALLTLGLVWALAALGVYWRDLQQLVGPFITALLFLSPVFYPSRALPEAVRPWLVFNPLAWPIETTRAIVLESRAPDWGALGVYLFVALACALAGHRFFSHLKQGFADVV